MPDVAFATSPSLTLGIEEEFLLVQRAGDRPVAARADELLDGDWQTIATPGGWFKPELLRCSIELATAPSDRLIQLDVDLNALRDELVARADRVGIDVVALGLHPDLSVTDELVTPTDSHRSIAQLHERVGTLAHQSTHGVHVHVGMPDLAAAVRVTDALAAYVPLLVACSAHSPVEHGVRSPWRSARSELQRRVLWAGPTPRLSGVEEYRAVHALHQLENDGDQRFLWEVAPVPGLGTVEVRAIDSQRDADVSLGIAALVQGIAAHVLDGGEVQRPSESLERHNRWSAMEFATRARFLVVGRDAPVDATELLHDAVELARPYARDLGNEAWLAVFDRIVAAPPVDAAIAAFEAAGIDGLLAHARVRASSAADQR